MSILNTSPNPDPAVAAAEMLKRQARTTFFQLVRTFNQTSRLFWQNSQATPAEIAAALGTDAVEVFTLHGKIGQLLGSVKPETIAPGMAVVGEFEYNEDGTVTIAEESAE